MWLLLRSVAARRAALRLMGGGFRGGGGGGGGAGWPLWRLGAGLGLAATAVAVAGPERDSEERPPGEAAFQRAVARSRELLQRLKDQVGIPGVVVGVSVDGKEVWSAGVGYADLENRVLCSPETVLRIASISKSLTMVAVAKLTLSLAGFHLFLLLLLWPSGALENSLAPSSSLGQPPKYGKSALLSPLALLPQTIHGRSLQPFLPVPVNAFFGAQSPQLNAGLQVWPENVWQ
ncbi:serine beta-lactamase-like protein LACTB, mitochondrial [Erythrolamprus reginae]|uniref:serine beta-lactamase-like protein LACTB, mitochondrial n=1 Tax=Erythrolamprus reginae TaxID=121349 RepID=UPI00396CAD4F